MATWGLIQKDWHSFRVWKLKPQTCILFDDCQVGGGGGGSSVSKRSCIYFPHMASYCSRTVHHIWMWCNHRLLGKICIVWRVGSGFWRLQRRCCTKSFAVIALVARRFLWLYGVFHVSCKYYASSSPVIMKLEKVQQKLQMAHKKSCLLSTALRHSFYFEGEISQGFLY